MCCFCVLSWPIFPQGRNLAMWKSYWPQFSAKGRSPVLGVGCRIGFASPCQGCRLRTDHGHQQLQAIAPEVSADADDYYPGGNLIECSAEHLVTQAPRKKQSSALHPERHATHSGVPERVKEEMREQGGGSAAEEASAAYGGGEPFGCSPSPEYDYRDVPVRGPSTPRAILSYLKPVASVYNKMGVPTPPATPHTLIRRLVSIGLFCSPICLAHVRSCETEEACGFWAQGGL